MMKALAIIFFVSLANSCLAFMADFEDIPLSTKFGVGTMFTSGDLQFRTGAFDPSSTVFIGAQNYAKGSGHEAFMGAEVGVELNLPASVSGVSFLYGEYNPFSNLLINGASLSGGKNIGTSNGLVVGGVSIAATSNNVTGGKYGVVTLTGPINSLVILGTELAIDNLSVTAPFSPDFDWNRVVDGNDFLLWQRGLGSSNAAPRQGDADGNRLVNSADLAQWKSRIGKAPAQTIPEPTAEIASVIAMLAAAIAGRRSRTPSATTCVSSDARR
jgi:hypothetical protein